MPPRKKSTTDAPAAPTRSSTRNKDKAAQQVQAAAAATSQSNDDGPTAAAKKPVAKRKRGAAASDDEADASTKAKKPASKKAKKSAAIVDDNADGDANDTMDVDKEEDNKKSESKKPASKKPASKKAVTKAADEEEAAEKDEAEEKKEAEKIVTVIKRGAAPVDPRSGKVNTHQVYSNDEGVWDATLNQTDVGDNKNKYYYLQLLHPIGNSSSCELYTHWGRVGEDGQHQTKGPFPAATAISEFKKQFKSKSGVDWDKRVGMVAKKGKYTWLERDYDNEEPEEGPSKPKSKKDTKKEARAIPDSTLSLEVQEFCRLIFNTSIIDATLSSMNYDANKLPLGKLAKSTILKGFTALKSLSEVIHGTDNTKIQEYGSKQRACEELTNLYYSIIPHNFGRTRPTIINNAELLKNELDLVDALGEMEIASQLMNAIEEEEAKNPINPLDAQFRSLELTSMDPVKRDSKEFKTIETYVHDTHGATHRHFKVDVQNVFRVERGSETQAWQKAGFDKVEDGERMLLWHGSRSTNFAGILKQGLRIAPPEAPVNGYMFGKGVYFADMMSKSAGYCYPDYSNGIGILLLCEVAVKPFYERYDAEYMANESCKKNGKRATKGIGRTQPNNWKDAGEALGVDELKGCHMPDGKPGEFPNQGYLQYNEYIVYDISQIRVKYLLMVKLR